MSQGVIIQWSARAPVAYAATLANARVLLDQWFDGLSADNALRQLILDISNPRRTYDILSSTLLAGALIELTAAQPGDNCPFLCRLLHQVDETLPDAPRVSAKAEWQAELATWLEQYQLDLGDLMDILPVRCAELEPEKTLSFLHNIRIPTGTSIRWFADDDTLKNSAYEFAQLREMLRLNDWPEPVPEVDLVRHILVLLNEWLPRDQQYSHIPYVEFAAPTPQQPLRSGAAYWSPERPDIPEALKLTPENMSSQQRIAVLRELDRRFMQLWDKVQFERTHAHSPALAIVC